MLNIQRGSFFWIQCPPAPFSKTKHSRTQQVSAPPSPELSIKAWLHPSLSAETRQTEVELRRQQWFIRQRQSSRFGAAKPLSPCLPWRRTRGPSRCSCTPLSSQITPTPPPDPHPHLRPAPCHLFTLSHLHLLLIRGKLAVATNQTPRNITLDFWLFNAHVIHLCKIDFFTILFYYS